MLARELASTRPCMFVSTLQERRDYADAVFATFAQVVGRDAQDQLVSPATPRGSCPMPHGRVVYRAETMSSSTQPVQALRLGPLTLQPVSDHG